MPLLTIADVAERWRCSRRYVQKLVASGALPRVPLGPRLTRIRLEDIEALEARTEPVPSPPPPPPVVPPLRDRPTAAKPRL
jgi:excisionase family DNA binding protein